MPNFENMNVQPPISEEENDENLAKLLELGEKKLAEELKACGVSKAEELARELLEEKDEPESESEQIDKI